MNKKISVESKLKLLDFLEEEFKTRKATIKNLLKNNLDEKERYSLNSELRESNLAVLIDCERSLRRFTKNLEEINEYLENLRIWRKEITESET